MKTRRIIFFGLIALISGILVFSAGAFAQEKQVVYIFLYADVETDGQSYRYFSTILDQPVRINENCLINEAKKSIEIKAGNGATIGKIELEKSGSFQEAEELILHKYTIPGRKVSYFQVDPDC